MSNEKLACLGKCALWHDSSLEDCKKIECPHIISVKEYTWKSFSSAPKDGTEFLVRYPLQNNVKIIIRWDLVHLRWQANHTPVFGLEKQECEWCEIPE